jgi:hypothetical protein
VRGSWTFFTEVCVPGLLVGEVEGIVVEEIRVLGFEWSEGMLLVAFEFVEALGR